MGVVHTKICTNENYPLYGMYSSYINWTNNQAPTIREKLFVLQNLFSACFSKMSFSIGNYGPFQICIPSERAPSKLSEKHKIVEFGPSEL